MSYETCNINSEGSNALDPNVGLFNYFTTILDTFKEGNGNCLFRSLSLELEGDPDHYQEIRSAIWDHKNIKNIVAAFITIDFDD